MTSSTYDGRITNEIENTSRAYYGMIDSYHPGSFVYSKQF